MYTLTLAHRGFISGALTGPFGFLFSPFIVAHSGTPFNITTGQDLNGDSLFTDRPGGRLISGVHLSLEPSGESSILALKKDKSLFRTILEIAQVCLR